MHCALHRSHYIKYWCVLQWTKSKLRNIRHFLQMITEQKSTNNQSQSTFKLSNKVHEDFEICLLIRCKKFELKPINWLVKCQNEFTRWRSAVESRMLSSLSSHVLHKVAMLQPVVFHRFQTKIGYNKSKCTNIIKQLYNAKAIYKQFHLK